MKVQIIVDIEKMPENDSGYSIVGPLLRLKVPGVSAVFELRRPGGYPGYDMAPALRDGKAIAQSIARELLAIGVRAEIRFKHIADLEAKREELKRELADLEAQINCTSSL